MLAIYGLKFVDGHHLLPVLLLGTLFYSCFDQLLNTLNGIDRPDIAFRVNALFIGFNAVANVGLVYAIGWTGTALSAGLGLVAAFYALQGQIDFELPVAEIGRQWAAAIAMAVVVYPLTTITGPLSESLEATLVTAGIVGIGATVYVGVLFAMSPKFRTVVRNNAPIDIPRVAGR